MHRPSPYPSLKKKKVFQLTYQNFHTKCYYRNLHIKTTEVVLQEELLDYLDLAIPDCYLSRKWMNEIKLQIIRCLPPHCAEYLLPETKHSKYSMLELVFRMLTDKIRQTKEIYQQSRQLFEKALCVAFEKHILLIENFDYTFKKKYIQIYLKLVDLIVVSRSESYRNQVQILYKLLLRTLCNDFPDDSQLAVAMFRWLKLMCVHDASKLAVFLEIMDNKCLEYLICRAQDVQFDFWGLWRGVGSLSASFNPVAVLIGNGRNVEARVLLKYGFPYSPAGMVYEERCHSLLFRRYHNFPIIDERGLEALKQKRPRHRMLLILDILITFADFEFTFDISDSISTLVQLSRSLPHPYVTSDEVYYNLLHVLQPTFHWRFAHICKKFRSEGIYDDDYKRYRPRNLLHLSRCAIRRILVDNLKFPSGIDELKLNRPLKEYLLLER